MENRIFRTREPSTKSIDFKKKLIYISEDHTKEGTTELKRTFYHFIFTVRSFES